MAARRTSRDQVDFALRRHFSAVFTPAEREVLVDVILAWDAQHAHLERAARIEGWLAVARTFTVEPGALAIAR